MLLIIISVLILLSGVVPAVYDTLSHKYNFKLKLSEFFEGVYVGFITLGLVLCMICTIIVLMNNSKYEINTTVEQMNSTRSTLVNILTYDKENTIVLVGEINDYNNTVLKYKNMKKSIWLNVFVPDEFTNFELINIEDYYIKGE